MTDPSLPHTTHTASPFKSLGKPVSPVDGPPAVATTADSPVEEEEDYTIKCFCSFQVDDGNTVYCDRCETWQHIECYYFQDFQDGQPPDIKKIVHSCIDCDPRPYDKKGATERQKERFYPEERKVKKAPAKAPKRRPKLSESHAGLTNGYTHDGADYSPCERTSGSPRDPGPPLKRPKTSHRSSHSMNFSPPSNAEVQAVSSAGATSHASRKSHNRKHSPNGYLTPPYSQEFLNLYDGDPGEAPIHANLFNDVAIAGSLFTWSHDVEALSKAANGLSPQNVFYRCDESLDNMNLPLLHKEHRVGEPLEDGQKPKWTYLTVGSDTPRDAIVGELRGKIGHMQDYVQDPANRWDYLRHPAPFVFFHPKLPIYVDTRQEGSICRYLRRSCRPNLEMRTILEDGKDYRFCFIAKEDIGAGSELTISWTLDQHIRTHLSLQRNSESNQEDSSERNAYISDWVEKVLANFGGCACESLDQCGLAKYDRRIHSLNNKSSITNGKASKIRNGYIKSTRTPEAGHNLNSRASSEGKKLQEDDGHDSRSTSGSNSRSRDLTPTRTGNGDLGTVPGLELSVREKRKIAAMEKNFEQLEQEKHQPVQRKKKRNSAGSALNTPTAATSVRPPLTSSRQHFADGEHQKQLGHGITFPSQPNTPAATSIPRYVHGGISGKNPGSPAIKSTANPVAFAKDSQTSMHPVTSPTLGHNYQSVSIQTDADDAADHDARFSYHSRKPKQYVSLGKRLLIRCQRDRERMDQGKKLSLADNKSAPNEDLAADISEVQFPEHTTMGGSSEDTTKDLPGESKLPDFPHDGSPTNVDPHLNDDSLKHKLSHVETEDPLRPHSSAIKAPPPPDLLHAPTAPPTRTKAINGFRSTDLRVQLPSVPPIPHDPASAPSIATVTTPAVARSPFSHTANSYPPLFPGSTPGAVQPSPVKKVTLGEYFNRQRNKTQSLDGVGAAYSPITQQSVLKSLESVDEEIRGDSMGGNAIVDTPKKEDDADPLAGRKASV